MITVLNVTGGSKAEEYGIKRGDVLISVNGNGISDVLDYRFYTTEKLCHVLLCRDGKELEISVAKDEYEDLGIECGSYLMDKKRSCANNCIFCFIDQNPCGMRETIYFKDDDERLSFLQGSYITLTNLSRRDILRIVKMRISPINISVHTTNPELRQKMLCNKNAGKCLEYLQILADADIAVNAQIVLCRGVNDGKELERTLIDLCKYENLQSVAVVPSGLTKHRDGLYPLVPFDSESANAVLEITERFGNECMDKTGTRIVYAADELFLLAGKAVPDEDYYEDYPQLENGVGMLRLHEEEFKYALANHRGCVYNRKIIIATGKAAYGHITALADMFYKKSGLLPEVCAIRNDFFGETVTVSGLVTGGDLINQLKGKTASELFIPCNMLRAERDLFLDGVSITDVESALDMKLVITEKNGKDLCEKLYGKTKG